jgi:hypothetical protein
MTARGPVPQKTHERREHIVGMGRQTDVGAKERLCGEGRGGGGALTHCIANQKIQNPRSNQTRAKCGVEENHFEDENQNLRKFSTKNKPKCPPPPPPPGRGRVRVRNLLRNVVALIRAFPIQMAEP